jgi:hypothetical protein
MAARRGGHALTGPEHSRRHPLPHRQDVRPRSPPCTADPVRLLLSDQSIRTRYPPGFIAIYTTQVPPVKSDPNVGLNH